MKFVQVCTCFGRVNVLRDALFESIRFESVCECVWVCVCVCVYVCVCVCVCVLSRYS